MKPANDFAARLGSLEDARVRDVLRAIARGARRVHLVDVEGNLHDCSGPQALRYVAPLSAVRKLAWVPGAEAAAGVLFDARLRAPTASNDACVAATRLTVEWAARQPVRPLRPGPLRVAHVVSSFAPGGSERQAASLARTTAAAGHSVRVIALCPLVGEGAHYLGELKGIEVRALRPRPRWRRVPGLPLPPAMAAQLDRHPSAGLVFALVEDLRRDAPDVVHAWLDEINVIAGVAALAAGVPRIVLGLRSLTPPRSPHLHKAWFEGGYRALAGSPRVRLLANSAAVARDFEAWLGLTEGAIAIAPNALDGEAWRPLTAEERVEGRARLGVGPSHPLVAGVFRLSPEKRPLDFVAALAHARRSTPGLRAVHVGDGPLGAPFEQAISTADLDGTVRRLGIRRDVRGIVGLADILLLPSQLEGMPNVALEALALGVPVVATRTGGIPEVVADGETGLLAPVGDAVALGEAIVALLSDPDRRARLGRRGAERVRQEFTSARALQRTLAVYRDPPGDGSSSGAASLA